MKVTIDPETDEERMKQTGPVVYDRVSKCALFGAQDPLGNLRPPTFSYSWGLDWPQTVGFTEECLERVRLQVHGDH